MTKTAARRVTYLTAGAAGMYCGSCMHDNALAGALIRAGWDTMLVPVYTPIRTDEDDTSIDQVFFGGINVYLQQKIPLFRHVPRILDRFLNHPRLIRKVTSKALETSPRMLGELTVSMLRGSQGFQRKEVRRLVSWLRSESRPEILVLSNILIGGFVSDLKREMQIPVAVTLQGDDVFLKALPEPWQSRSLELIRGLDPQVDAYLVHSKAYADEMSRYAGLSRNKMHVTPLGIDTRLFESLPPRMPGKDSGTVTIGYLARLSPEKGLDLLVDAFLLLKQRPGMEHARLKIAGWLGPDHVQFADRQIRKLQDAGLSEHYEHAGSPSRNGKMDFLASLDILSVPANFFEPKGLYVLEGLAAGVPYVQPDHGVFPEMHADLGGGLLFPAGDAHALADQLEFLIRNPAERHRLGELGRANVFARRNGEVMARATIQVLESLFRKAP